MRGSLRLAMAVMLLWLAGFAFYIAFHPGGIKLGYETDDKGKPKKDKHGDPIPHQVENPVDVLKWFIETASKG